MEINPKHGTQQNTRNPASKKMIPVVMSMSLVATSLLAGGLNVSAKEIANGNVQVDQSIQSSLKHSNEISTDIKSLFGSFKKGETVLELETSTNVGASADLNETVDNSVENGITLKANLSDDEPLKSEVEVGLKKNVAKRLGANAKDFTGENVNKDLQENRVPPSPLIKPYFSFIDYYKLYFSMFLNKQPDISNTIQVNTAGDYKLKNENRVTTEKDRPESIHNVDSGKDQVKPEMQEEAKHITKTESVVTGEATTKGGQQGELKDEVSATGNDTKIEKPSPPPTESKSPEEIGDTEYKPMTNLNAQLWLNSDLQLTSLHLSTNSKITIR
ncbi:hypothetical protein AWH56_010065 [Anaerobacillus isosaccharinicus]|uniref:Uncharacterized protein n=1 Tax=Anaerobacillus isosaccharinicus TaxID=1532552 RepID=A0A1S2L5D5_9BACI|nr:hypothetical protein [Anaerobacillus isosaccharinicus]MBA5588726.1 hypothetical protein [Anaerobacillus isosaccharinicus]QOY37874.1 hypothetical protein AWH56_010065 [Anaerobacillus isosaccharinicus]